MATGKIRASATDHAVAVAVGRSVIGLLPLLRVLLLLLPSLSVTGSPFSPFVLEKREREGRLLSDVAIAVAAVATAAAADQTSAR